MIRASLLLLTAVSLVSPAPKASVNEERVEHHENGAIKAKYKLDAQGRKSGAYLAYYEDGGLRVKARYKGDELNGKYESFFPDGERWVTATYRLGLLEGKYIVRRPDGETLLQGKYKKGLRQGVFQLKVKGKTRHEQQWKDGDLLTLDGVRLYPKSLAAIADTLDRIEDPAKDWGGENIRLIEDRSGETTVDTEAHIADRDGAFRRLMAYRYLCDLPWDDMELSPRFNYHTAIGSKLLEEIGQLTHYPKNPGWEKDPFRDAYEGTSSSNLSMGSGMLRSVDSYMDDSDPSNIGHVGHRVWCLHPRLKITGFGRSGRFSGMWVKDKSRSTPFDYDVILYPPRGHLPSEYFGARHAWSVQVNPANHGVPQVKNVEPRIYEVDEDLLPYGEPLELDHLGVNGHTIIFRPARIDVSPGKRYWAEIHGVRSGKVGTALSYLVEFVERPQLDGGDSER